MKQIAISGVIGWDVLPADVRSQLAAAAGEEVEFVISSPGGFVGDGLEIFNLIRNYQGETVARLSGYAMSMASYIPLAAKRIVAEDNAVFMIHNVRGGIIGDHNDILKYGTTVQAMSRMIARAYAKHTGKSLDEVQQWMDQETYFFGQDMLDAGFAHEIIATENEADREAAKAVARMAFDDCHNRMTQNIEAVRDDLSKAAALAGKLPGEDQGAKSPRAQAPATKGAQIMTLEQLRADHPELVAALVAEAIEGMINQDELQQQIATARAEGEDSERKRIADVRAQAIPGHEELIEQMAFDGQSTGADAAKAIVAAERSLREQAAGHIENDAPPAVPHAAAEGSGGKKRMKRKDFNALGAAEQQAFVRAGGQIVD